MFDTTEQFASGAMIAHSGNVVGVRYKLVSTALRKKGHLLTEKVGAEESGRQESTIKLAPVSTCAYVYAGRDTAASATVDLQQKTRGQILLRKPLEESTTRSARESRRENDCQGSKRWSLESTGLSSSGDS